MNAPTNGENIIDNAKKPPKDLPLLLAPAATAKERTNHKIKPINIIKSS